MSFDSVLIVSFGGPQGLADIRPFLANVLRGRRVSPGRVEEVAVLRSLPLLDRAAVDAVRQWVYAPLLLNGQAERFILTVTVSFSLS